MNAPIFTSFASNDRKLAEMICTAVERDCWSPSYNGAPADGSPWTSGDCTKRVMRKASFANGRPFTFRAANRFAELLVAKRNRTGFRVALTLP